MAACAWIKDESSGDLHLNCPNAIKEMRIPAEIIRAISNGIHNNHIIMLSRLQENLEKELGCDKCDRRLLKRVKSALVAKLEGLQ